MDSGLEEVLSGGLPVARGRVGEPASLLLVQLCLRTSHSCRPCPHVTHTWPRTI